MTQKKVARSFKILLLGDPRVGKTSLRRRYMGEGFQTDYISTLGADFAITEYRDCQLQIWDLAGYITYKEILDHFLRGGKGILVVYDITRRETLETVHHWIDRFLKVTKKIVPIILVGNKTDLRAENYGSVTLEDGEALAQELSTKYKAQIYFIETSALAGENIDQAFETLIDAIIDNL